MQQSIFYSIFATQQLYFSVKCAINIGFNKPRHYLVLYGGFSQDIRLEKFCFRKLNQLFIQVFLLKNKLPLSDDNEVTGHFYIDFT